MVAKSAEVVEVGGILMEEVVMKLMMRVINPPSQTIHYIDNECPDCHASLFLGENPHCAA